MRLFLLGNYKNISFGVPDRFERTALQGHRRDWEFCFPKMNLYKIVNCGIIIGDWLSLFSACAGFYSFYPVFFRVERAGSTIFR